MPSVTSDVLFRMANAVLAASALSVAGLIVAAITKRKSRNLEPLGLAFLAMFLAIGLRATVRASLGGLADTGENVAVYIAVDWIGAVAAVAFLFLHKRYGIFIESATI